MGLEENYYPPDPFSFSFFSNFAPSKKDWVKNTQQIVEFQKLMNLKMIMKRYFLSLLLSCMAYALYAQTYHVGTTMQKKHVLVEEFTGVLCSACPYGHQAAANLKNRYGCLTPRHAMHRRCSA